MTIVQRKMEIRMLIVNASIDNAFKRAMDFVHEFSSDNDLLNEVTIHCGNYNRLNREIRQNIITYDDADVKRSRLLHNILQIIEEVESNFSMANQYEVA